MTTYHVTVSGKTFFAALDPLATGAHDEGLIAIDWRRIGKGRQYRYDLDVEHLRALIDRLDCVGTSFLDADDPDSLSEARSCLRDRDRLRAALAKIEAGPS